MRSPAPGPHTDLRIYRSDSNVGVCIRECSLKTRFVTKMKPYREVFGKLNITTGAHRSRYVGRNQGCYQKRGAHLKEISSDEPPSEHSRARQGNVTRHLGNTFGRHPAERPFARCLAGAYAGTR